METKKEKGGLESWGPRRLRHWQEYLLWSLLMDPFLPQTIGTPYPRKGIEADLRHTEAVMRRKHAMTEVQRGRVALILRQRGFRLGFEYGWRYIGGYDAVAFNRQMRDAQVRQAEEALCAYLAHDDPLPSPPERSRGEWVLRLDRWER